jgi:hypothetical protein
MTRVGSQRHGGRGGGGVSILCYVNLVYCLLNCVTENYSDERGPYVGQS